MHHLLSFLDDALQNHFDWLCFYVFFALALAFPRLGNFAFAPIERIGSRLAAHKGFCVAAISLAAIVIRVAFLGVDYVPVPLVHDEFSYLLAGDTFAHWRLTNPTHPMWIFFESFHTIQHPSYASKYPPAQGMVLALGQIFGHPWIGVLLSVGVMCGAVLWMLQGWLPARWALYGGVLVLLRFAVFNDWVEGYWGGAVAAIGGALVMGALPRIMRAARPRYAVWMGLGASILANSRPLEGLIFFATVIVALGLWIRKQPAADRANIYARVVFPMAAVLLVCAGWIGYYNWRVTGHALLFPYVVYQRTYDPEPFFVWQSRRPTMTYNNPQFANFYNVWEPQQFGGGWDDIMDATGVKISEFFNFFFNKELALGLLGIPWVLWRDRRKRFVGAQFGVCLVGMLCVIWFWPHYAAPLMGTTFALLVQGMRRVRRWRVRGWRVGFGLTRAVVLVSLGWIVSQVQGLGSTPFEVNDSTVSVFQRDYFDSQLQNAPGQQLVIVRYGPQHNPNQEWVYNGADIDHAKVVWAREIPGVSIQPLLDYFRGRRVWLAQPDVTPLQLTPYAPPAAASRPAADGQPSAAQAPNARATAR
jgi:hypothetical protein